MTYHAQVKDGRIEMHPPVTLPEGTWLRVEVVTEQEVQPEMPADVEPLTLWERLRSVAGTVEGPEDWARNHDHYIHGTPKRP